VAGLQCKVLALRIFLFDQRHQRKRVREVLDAQISTLCNIDEVIFHLNVPSIFLLRSHRNMEVVIEHFC
jgi:hypothetical protein